MPVTEAEQNKNKLEVGEIQVLECISNSIGLKKIWIQKTLNDLVLYMAWCCLWRCLQLRFSGFRRI